jgi:hypothetical protein
MTSLALAILIVATFINVFFISVSLLKPQWQILRILALSKLCLATIAVEIVIVITIAIFMPQFTHETTNASGVLCGKNDYTFPIILCSCIGGSIASFSLEPPLRVIYSEEVGFQVFYRKHKAQTVSEEVAIRSIWGTIRFCTLNICIFPIVYLYDFGCSLSN